MVSISSGLRENAQVPPQSGSSMMSVTTDLLQHWDHARSSGEKR